MADSTAAFRGYDCEETMALIGALAAERARLELSIAEAERRRVDAAALLEERQQPQRDGITMTVRQQADAIRHAAREEASTILAAARQEADLLREAAVALGGTERPSGTAVIDLRQPEEGASVVSTPW